MSLLERNLEALRRWTPATADLVAAATIPPDFQPTPGTDGTPTFCRRIDDPAGRRLEWLGAVSMPRSAADALVAAFDVGAGNGLGLGIGTGYEWAAFLRRLSLPQALFVYEPDAAHLRMALEICDLTGPLTAGKLLLVTGPLESAANELSSLLAANVGLEPPTVLQPLPTLGGERRNALLTSGEAMVRRVVAERQHVTTALAARVESVLNRLAGTAVAMTLTPRYAGERPLLREITPAVPELRIDHHLTTSLAARLAFIADHRPALIRSDLFRPQLACIPHTIAVETWVPPLVGAGYWNRLPPAAAITPIDRIVVHVTTHADRLRAQGIAEQNIHLRPLTPVASSRRRSDPLAIRHRLALIADLQSIEPASLGLELPTQLAVLHAAQELIAADYLTVHTNSAPDLLRRAMTRAGVPAGEGGVSDPAFRGLMLRVVKDLLIPVVPMLTLARTLIQERVPLRLVGDWTGLQLPEGDQVLVEPFPADGTAEWSDVAVLLHHSTEGAVSPLMWDAIAAEVVLAAPQHGTDAMPGSLATLLAAGTDYAHPTPSQLLPTLKSLLRDAGRRASFIAAAQRKLPHAS